MTKKLLIVLKDANDTRPSSIASTKLSQILENAGVPSDEVQIAYAGQVERILAEKHNFNVIVPMGGEAYESVTDSNLTVGAARGEWEQTKWGVKMLPTFAPGFSFQKWDNQETIEYDFRKAYRWADTPAMPSLLLGEDYFVVTDIEEARRCAAYLKTGKYLAFDIETEGFDLFTDDEILCVQFSIKPGEAFVLPLRGAWERHERDVYSLYQVEHGFWRFVEDDNDEVFKVLSKTDEPKKPEIWKPEWPKGSLICNDPIHEQPRGAPKAHRCRGILTDVLGGEYVKYDRPGRMFGKRVPADYIIMRDILEDILGDPSTIKVAFNGNFDAHGVWYQLGIYVRNFTFDPMLAYHQFHEVGPHNLEFVRNRITDMPKYDQWKAQYLHPGASFAEAPNEVLWHYGAADADVERRTVEPLIEAIQYDNPEDGWWLFQNVDMPFNRTLRQIEQNGMLIDPARFDVLCDVYSRALRELSQKIDTACREHNITPLETYTNAHTLRPFLFEKEYEIVLEKERWYKHKECKGLGCTSCVDGKYLGKPAVTRPMRGLGFPSYLVETSEKTDEAKTDSKALIALKAWCNESVRYSLSTITKKNGEEKQRRKRTNVPLSDREHARRGWMLDIIKLIENYKKASQAINLFLDGQEDRDNREMSVGGAKAMLQHIKWDGRVHSQYKQLTKTGRTSSSAPNLENISNEAEYFKGYGIRTMFVAPDGCDFGEADYAQQELRVLAYLAGEDVLHDILLSCETCGENFRPTEDDPERPFKMKSHLAVSGHKAYDPHRSMAGKAFKLEYEKVSEEQRTFAKRVVFGINYGQSDYGLSIVLGVPIEEASQIISDVLDAQPKVRRFQARQRSLVRRGLHLPNAYGRKRRFYGVSEMRQFVFGYDYDKILNAMERQGVNFPVQSTPADIMANVATALFDVWGVEHEDWKSVESLVIAHELMGGQHPSLMLQKMGVKPVNVVYDSAEFESPTENREEVGKVVEFVMERLPWEQLSWYLPVDLQFGRYWGQAKVEKEKAA